MDILLTQMCLPKTDDSATGCRALIPLGSPLADVSDFFRSVEDENDFGMVQYFHDHPTRLLDSLPHPVGGNEPARYLCRLVSDTGAVAEVAPVLMIVAFCVPEAQREEVDAWYREEHIPLLSKADGWLRARRYEPFQQSGGPTYTSLALHELRSVSVLDSPERRIARNTPWRAQFADKAWFGQAGRWVYKRLSSDGPYFG